MPVTSPAVGGRTLSEAASKRLVAAYGVPVPEEREVPDPPGAVAAAAELGFPVALKLCGPGIAHKTERGLVRLGLGEGAAVERAAAGLLAAAQPTDGPVTLLVAPMATFTRELIAGLLVDPTFGPCVMLGIGGILAEALADVTFRLAPIETVDAEDMIDDLRSRAVLGPFRGEGPVDRAALTGVLCGLGRLAVEHPEVRSVDLNPLAIVDGRPVALDALVELDP